jgi:hypothetical protein
VIITNCSAVQNSASIAIALPCGADLLIADEPTVLILTWNPVFRLGTAAEAGPGR